MRKLRILVSNDDGVHALGIRILYRELRKIAEVKVVAPLDEKSTTGHSLTLHKPLRVIPIEKDFYGCSGSPADCVYLGLRHLYDSYPDLVISGINRGANLGQDVYYSGTVSAAREASILGIPSIAVSLCINFAHSGPDTELHFATAARVAARLVRQFKREQLPHHTLLNLNVPDVPLGKVKGIRLARQGFQYYGGTLLKRKDHRGRDYFWVGGKYKGFKNEQGTDCAAVAEGYASLTPLKLDSTDLQYLASLSEDWPQK